MVLQSSKSESSLPSATAPLPLTAEEVWLPGAKKAVLITTSPEKLPQAKRLGSKSSAGKLQPLQSSSSGSPSGRSSEKGKQVRSASHPTIDRSVTRLPLQDVDLNDTVSDHALQALAMAETTRTSDRPRTTSKQGRTPSRGNQMPTSPFAATQHGSVAEILSSIHNPTAPTTEEKGSSEAALIRADLIRIRKRLHETACELQRMKEQYELAQRELHLVRSSNDELRLKYSSLEKIAQTTSAELVSERRKSDELSKQVKAMSQNLMSIMGQHEKSGTGQDITGLQKRCFKLVQANTALTVQSSLLRRQKGWAEAKARILQDEVTRVYLGVHDQVRSSAEVERDTSREFAHRQTLGATVGVSGGNDGAVICKLLIPFPYKHREAVIDFLTHVTHTSGNDVHGFLASNRVFSESIRTECISGLGREYYAHWRSMRQLPMVLRATERLVHLGEHLEAFEGFASESSELLCCGLAKLWVVDHFRQTMWTCYRSGEDAKTFEVPLPKHTEDLDMTGIGLVMAAALEHKVISVPDAAADPRFHSTLDSVGGRPARSELCVPVMQKGQTKVVFQAVNKLEQPEFDPENDAKILRLLGRVSMEVLQVCQSNTTQSAFTKRKTALLQLFTDFTPIECGYDLIAAMERGLRDLFLSEAASLHLIKGACLEGKQKDPPSSVLIQVDNTKGTKTLLGRRRSSVVQRIETRGFQGLIGACVKSMQNLSVSYAQRSTSAFDPAVDMPIAERSLLHTVPIVGPNGVVAVCQFLCPDREQSVLQDDGTYKPDNPQHSRLLQFLLRFIQKHLDIVDKPVPPAAVVRRPSMPRRLKTTGSLGGRSVGFPDLDDVATPAHSNESEDDVSRPNTSRSARLSRAGSSSPAQCQCSLA